MEAAEEVEEEDDLGYYPNGVKRTLTDEQIAMFRHSEIYAIIRQRQLRVENQGVGQEDRDSEENEDLHIEGQTTAVMQGHFHTTEAATTLPSPREELVNSDDEEEYVRFLEAEKKDVDTENTRKKRKRNGRDMGGKFERAPTHRRLARELDEAVVDEGVLDYGEEPLSCTNANQCTPQMDLLEERHERKAVVYDDGDADQPVVAAHALHTTTIAPEQGRKIWWPTIGT